MNKKTVALIISSAIMALTSFAAAEPLSAAEAQDSLSLRIGLETKYREKDSIAAKNTTLSIGYGDGNNFEECLQSESSSGFVFAASNENFVKLGEEYSSYTRAREAASVHISSGLKAVPCFSQYWNVYIGGFPSDSLAQSFASSNGGQYPVQSSSLITITSSNGAIAMFDGVYPQVKSSFGSQIELGDRKYRGIIELGRYEKKKLSAVNIVPMSEYLYSVVPSEMSPSWHIEALKAQACAARTFAISRSGYHKTNGYDLCDTTHCQAYKGVTNEHESTTRAVNETAGISIYYNDKPILAQFFASSGGRTDDSENAWSNKTDYLRGVVELNEIEPTVWTRSFNLDEITGLLNATGSNIGHATGMQITKSAPGGWNTELTVYGTIGSKVIKGESIRTFFSSSRDGSLKSRNFTIAGSQMTSPPATQAPATPAPTATRTPTPPPANSQNPNEIVYVTNGESVAKISLRSVSAISLAGTSHSLNTELIAVLSNVGSLLIPVDNKPVQTAAQTPAPAPTLAPQSAPVSGEIVISGRGYGHGVGMSQYGARGLAEMGYTYDRILKYYYTGVEVK